MNPVKVDSVLKWKMPTGKDGVLSFLGSVSYLADDVSGICIPMGILHGISGSTSVFRWDDTHQRAFEEIRDHKFCEHRCRPISYQDGAPPINLITDASNSGLAGVISQGKNWKMAPVAAFFSAKLTPTQQNYPIHEQEMLAGLESMLMH
jgi:hypothetical protein